MSFLQGKSTPREKYSMTEMMQSISYSFITNPKLKLTNYILDNDFAYISSEKIKELLMNLLCIKYTIKGACSDLQPHPQLFFKLNSVCWVILGNLAKYALGNRGYSCFQANKGVCNVTWFTLFLVFIDFHLGICLNKHTLS